MKNYTLICLTVLSSVFFFSCDEETETILVPSNIGPTLSNSEIDKFFEDNLEDATQTINANSSNSIQTITSNKGFTYSYGPNTFINASGNPVSGSFTIEVVEATTKKEMMMINRPTFTHSGRLLVSGGVVSLNATQNGQQLSINDSEPVSASIPTDNYIPMDFFDGGLDSLGGFGWDESEDDTVITNTGNNNGQDSTFFEDMFSFDFEIDSIGWINCDYFYDSNGPLTQVEVVLPDTFNGDNSAVFIYYSDINSVASLSDYDTDGTFDLGASYSTPVDMDVSFIVISEHNGSFYYQLTEATITQDHIEVISELTLLTVDELEIILNSL